MQSTYSRQPRVKQTAAPMTWIRPPDLARMVVGERLNDSLLVLEVEHRESPRGAFTLLTLGNRHGKLPSAPFWPEDRPRLAGIERGAVAQVSGEIGQYHGSRQLKVAAIRLVAAPAM